MTALFGAKEIKILALSLAGGFLLLFPRTLLLNEVAPSLVQTIQKSLEQFSSQASQELRGDGAGQPAKPRQAKPRNTARSGELRVEGIIYEGKGKSSVIINGQILVPGDSVGDYTVVEIESQHVVLRKGKDLYILSADSTLAKEKS